MTLTLELTTELERRLAQEARRVGVAPDQYALRLLEQHLAPKDRRAELVALLDSWLEDEDAEEQAETLEDLVRGLDEDRPSSRKLFPPELKGVTW
jgi:hypothetical protein